MIEDSWNESEAIVEGEGVEIHRGGDESERLIAPLRDVDDIREEFGGDPLSEIVGGDVHDSEGDVRRARVEEARSGDSPGLEILGDDATIGVERVVNAREDRRRLDGRNALFDAHMLAIPDVQRIANERGDGGVVRRFLETHDRFSHGILSSCYGKRQIDE